jgi:acetyl esterase/lipase
MALSYPTRPGDIDHLIADDHAIVERQFQHLEAGRGDRRTLVEQIVFELALHSYAEEVVLYPLWRKLGMEDFDRDARQQHGEIKDLLVALGKAEPGEEGFETALSELIALTRHHVEDEEQEALPAFRATVGAEKMTELGRQFLAAKSHAPPAPHPHTPDKGRIEKVVGAVAKPIDQVKAAVSGKMKRLATDASGLLEPQAQAIVDAHSGLGPLPLEILPPEKARAQPRPDNAVQEVMKDKGLTGPEPVGSVKDLRIPDAGGGEQTLRVYTPTVPAEGPPPIIMWIHGGGWVLFDIDTYDASCRGLTNKTGAIVVSPEYRRAPEHVFPASHDDVLIAWRWTAAHAFELGGDPARMGIGGESVGATMASATCLLLAEAGEPVPAAQVCVYPLTTVEQYGESMVDAADGRPLNRALLSWMAMHTFNGVPEAATDFRVDLLGWPREALMLTPPTLVITAERDVLRSQGQQFARNLHTAGVASTVKHYEGVMHEFFGASAVLDKAEHAQQDAAAHFTTAFARPLTDAPGPVPEPET